MRGGKERGIGDGKGRGVKEVEEMEKGKEEG
jgi:hypothetical protein